MWHSPTGVHYGTGKSDTRNIYYEIVPFSPHDGVNPSPAPGYMPGVII